MMAARAVRMAKDGTVTAEALEKMDAEMAAVMDGGEQKRKATARQIYELRQTIKTLTEVQEGKVDIRKETRSTFLDAHGQAIQARDAPGLADKAARKRPSPHFMHELTIELLLAEIGTVERDIMLLKLRERSQHSPEC
jgi:hypothetical protein